jgi:DNA-binding NarL/FixJ family response regulator
MTTIVLADDHHLVRLSLRILLETEPDFHIIGEAADGQAAVQLVEHLQPEVLILDLMMPGLSGLEVTRQVHQRVPQTRVIILSMYDDEAYVLQALKNGAAGYVLKKSTAAELFRAVHEVKIGRRYLSLPLSEEYIETLMIEADESKQDPYELLTPRELEVFHLVVEGHTNAQIAAQLVISRRTVEVHRANIRRKLGLRTQADLILYAIQQGLLPPEGKP